MGKPLLHSVLLLTAFVGGTSTPLLGQAQSDQKALAFEVASIKPSRVTGDAATYGRVFREASRISYEYVSLQSLLAQAFRIKNSQMSGPAWLDADRFDINATFPAGATDHQLQSMLQTLLRDRFNLSFHRQPKETDAYGLLVTKGGPKATLRNDEVGDVRTQFTGSIRHLSGNVTMEYLAGLLSNLVDRPVVDQTQLKGVYSITLEWIDDNAVTPSTPAEAVPLFTAIQEQLGLRLERRKTSVQMLVIDHVERPTPD